jgi:hypothetical protein
MNYFSHFVFDHQALNHEFNTGLLLPDITRKSIKKFYQSDKIIVSSQHHHQFLEGCLKHYLSDKKFHSSTFFSFYYHLLNQQISNSFELKNAERKWFISHILFELLIDRVIVNSHKHLLDSFYSSLLKVNEESLSMFLKTYEMKDIDKFFEFFNHFRNTQYIYHYTDNNKFMYSLNRIMLRAKVKELSQNENTILLNIVLEFEKNHFNDSEILLKKIRAILQ